MAHAYNPSTWEAKTGGLLLFPESYQGLLKDATHFHILYRKMSKMLNTSM